MELGKESSPFSNGDSSWSCPPHLSLSFATALEHFTIILLLVTLILLPSQFNLNLALRMKWRHISPVEQSYGHTSWQPQQASWSLIPNEGQEGWCWVTLVRSLSDLLVVLQIVCTDLVPSHRGVPAPWGPFLLQSRNPRGCSVTGVTLPTQEVRQPEQPTRMQVDGRGATGPQERPWGHP